MLMITSVFLLWRFDKEGMCFALNTGVTTKRPLSIFDDSYYNVVARRVSYRKCDFLLSYSQHISIQWMARRMLRVTCAGAPMQVQLAAWCPVKAACNWTTDSEKNTLANKLRISSIPTMVIVSPEGKILFNGQPSNINFWDTLKKIAPEFTRPNNQEDQHDHNHKHDDLNE